MKTPENNRSPRSQMQQVLDAINAVKPVPSETPRATVNDPEFLQISCQANRSREAVAKLPRAPR